MHHIADGAGLDDDNALRVRIHQLQNIGKSGPDSSELLAASRQFCHGLLAHVIEKFLLRNLSIFHGV
jgi:hypothetical protein